jgi:hypothetical protein
MVDKRDLQRQPWFGVTQYGELRSGPGRTLNSWSAWRINPTCERAPITTFLHSRAPKGQVQGDVGMELLTPFLAVMCVVLVVLLWREA